MSGKELLKKIALLIYAVLFKYCYITGLWVLSVLSTSGRFMLAGIRRTERAAGEGLGRLDRWRRQLSSRGADGLRRWGQRALDVPSLVRAARASAAAGDRRGALALLGRAGASLWHVAFPVVRTVVNWALPILAIVLLYQTVQGIAGRQYALRVRYGNAQTGYSDFGYITDESVYDEAVSEVLSKMKGVNNDTPIDFSAQFELTPVDMGEPMLDPYVLSNLIIASSGNDIESAYGLYVDGEFIEAVADPQPLLDLLTLLQDRYKSGDPTETVSFIKPVAVREGLYPSSRVKNLSDVRTLIDREVKGEFTYIVEEGDAPSLIADKFEVPLSQIVANNPGILEKLLIGDEVIVSRAEPYLSVKIQKVVTYEEEIPFSTETIEDSSLLNGQRSTISEGKNGRARVRAAVTYINDMESERSVLSREVVRQPVNAQVKVGTKMFMNGAGGGKVSSNFIVPVPGMTYISNYFYGNSYYRYFHGALDFAAPYGTPIYAAAPGTVTYSSYTPYGYGRHIIISHGGGIQTLYAHNSQNVVRVGDVVEQGQVIGYVGSTGNSTGNHCHFEIRVNGTKMDPSNYLY